jgi:hypothetical protein
MHACDGARKSSRSVRVCVGLAVKRREEKQKRTSAPENAIVGVGEGRKGREGKEDEGETSSAYG